jgi:non-specific protein-tyrosine kinase
MLVNTALSGALGLLIAVSLVALAGYLDDTIKTGDDVRRLTGKAALGSIPQLVAADGIESLRVPHSPTAERYRSLRTALQFATLGQPIRSLVMTSPRPGDGKTTTIANLGTVLAQAGQRVILVDANLRKPQLHTHFSGVTNRAGLTNLLLAQAGSGTEEALLQPTEIPGLRILTTGPLAPNPADVLNLPRMKEILSWLEDMADVVLIDAPPMAVSEPMTIAGLVDGILLVMVSGRIRSGELTRVIQELTRTATPLVGIVINWIDAKSDDYSTHYYSYYGTGSYRAEGDGPPPGSGTGLDGQHPSVDHPVRQFGNPGD